MLISLEQAKSELKYRLAKFEKELAASRLHLESWPKGERGLNQPKLRLAQPEKVVYEFKMFQSWLSQS